MKRYFLSAWMMLFIATGLCPAQAAPEPDPFLGSWRLDVEASIYPLGARPKQMTIEMTLVGNKVQYSSETVYPNGSSMRSKYVSGYDGKEVIVRGTAGMLLPVSLRRLDARTVVATYTRSLRVVATSRRVVSADGRVMTITTSSMDQEGKGVVTIGLYNKA
jgi:hypothetical protein